MASNSHVDLSGDICDFRRALSRALSQKLYILEKETDRLEQVLAVCPDKPAAEIGSWGGYPMLDKGSPRRYRIDGPNNDLSAQMAAEQFPERKALIESFLKNAAEDVGYVQDCFLLRSTLQYAVIRKEIVDLSCDYDVLKPYTGKFPSSDEIAEFLVDSYGYEKTLTRDFLTILANRYNAALPLLDVVCDNPILNSKNPDWGQAKKAISAAILGLGGDLVDFRKDMSAIMIAVDYHVFRDLESYISTAKKVTSDALSLNVFPLNEDKLEMLQFGALNFSGYLYGKDEYLKALTGALHDAEEKRYISAFERFAITGEAVPAAAPNGEEPTLAEPEAKADEDSNNRIFISINATHIEQTTAIQNNQQINIINPSATGQASPNGEAPANRSDQGSSPLLDGAEASKTQSMDSSQPSAAGDPPSTRPSPKREQAVSPMDYLVLPKDRMDRPHQYLGNKENAFSNLYTLMIGAYFECSSLENFTGLFRCPADNTKESYTRINWIHSSGITGLQCFLEALYRKKDDQPGFVNRAMASRVFLVNGEKKDLGKNLLYCWGKNKHIDPEHDQEKQIQGFLQLIKDSKQKKD